MTINDVGEAAGVSASTVSRVLNGTLKVAPDLAERVHVAVRELGYRPNAAAQGLARGETGAIGVLVPDLANPYFPDMLKAISRVARSNGRRVMVMESDEDPSVEHHLAEDLMRCCDGVLLCSPRMSRAELAGLTAHDYPFVLVNRIVPGLDVPSVSVDFFGGMTLICGHLAQLGHRRIAYLSGPEASWANSERIRAFTAAQAFGLEVTVVACGSTSLHGYEELPAALRTEASAVVCYNDLLALGAATRAEELGVRVPEDVSIIGFDDVAPDRSVRSSMTTVSVSRDRLGREAGTMLEQRMTAEQDSEPRYTPTELVVRTTSAPPRTTAGLGLPLPPAAAGSSDGPGPQAEDALGAAH